MNKWNDYEARFMRVFLCKGGGDAEIKETAEEREMAKIATEQWNDYQQRFLPLENRLFGEVRSTEGEYAQAAGYTNAATSQAFDGGEERARAGLFAGGSRPGSGKFADTMSGLANDEALSGALNQVDTGQQVSNQEISGLQSLVGLGRGQTNSAQGLLASGASNAQSQAYQDARNALQNRMNVQAGIGTVAGVGAASLYGNDPEPSRGSGFGLNTSSGGSNVYRDAVGGQDLKSNLDFSY